MTRFGSLWLEDTTSTNNEALALAKAGHPGCVFVAAKSQSCGRGRRGRTWVSPPGDLYCSLLLREDIPPDRRGEMAFVAGLAMLDAAAVWEERSHLTLKWPNDLLLDGRKLGGILIEADHDALIIGMGMNILHFPEDAEYPATSMAAALPGEVMPTPNDLLEKLSASMEKWLDTWKTCGFVKIRMEWLKVAAGLGDSIVARLENETVSGIFLDVDAQGALMLSMNGNAERRIAAGSIFFNEEP